MLIFSCALTENTNNTVVMNKFIIFMVALEKELVRLAKTHDQIYPSF
jgi:hypothetical protein